MGVRVSQHLAQLQRDSTELVWGKLAPILLFHCSEEVLYHCTKRSDQRPTREQRTLKDEIRLPVSSSMTNCESSGFPTGIVVDGREIKHPQSGAHRVRELDVVVIAWRKTFSPFLPFVLDKTPSSRMVVVNSEPSTSAPKRKNRRSLHKKKSAAVSQSTVEKIGVDVDQEMEPVDQEVYDPEPHAITPTTDIAVEEGDQDQPGGVGDDDEVMIDTNPSATTGLAPTSAPSFPALTGSALQTSLKSEMRRIPIPPHRMSPLKKDWINIFGPLTEILGLQVRMNVQRKAVEIRVNAPESTLSLETRTYISVVRHQNTQKRSGRSRKVQTLSKPTHSGLTLTYVPCYHPSLPITGCLTRHVGLYSPSTAGRSLPRLLRDQGCQNPARRPSRTRHRYLNRSPPNFVGFLITFTGRIAGQDGKTKFTIENASRTRIVLADTYVQSSSCLIPLTLWVLTSSSTRKIHILGSFQNIKVARDAIVSLILGSPPGKVYAGLRTVSSRMRQRAL